MCPAFLPTASGRRSGPVDEAKLRLGPRTSYCARSCRATDMRADVVTYIRAKIAAGHLPAPSDLPSMTWASNGKGRRCDGCDRWISDTETQYETDIPMVQTLRFHRACFRAWQAERPFRVKQ